MPDLLNYRGPSTRRTASELRDWLIILSLSAAIVLSAVATGYVGYRFWPGPH